MHFGLMYYKIKYVLFTHRLFPQHAYLLMILKVKFDEAGLKKKGLKAELFFFNKH